MRVVDGRPLSLRQNFSWVAASNVVYAFCQWGILVALARLGSPEMVGQFVLGLAVTAPIMLFANLRIRQLQATDARGEHKFGDYLGLGLLTAPLALLLIAAVAALSGYRSESVAVILAVACSKAVGNVSDVFAGAAQQRERLDIPAVAMVLRGVTSLVAMGATVAVSGSVLWGVLAMTAAWLAVLFAYVLPSTRRVMDRRPIRGPDDLLDASVRPRWEARRLRQLVRLSLPLGVTAMLVSLTPNIPRYFVERFMGEAQLGIFAALAYFTLAGATLAEALREAAEPRLALTAAMKGPQAFRRLLLRLLALGLLLGVVGVLVAGFGGELLLGLVYGPSYAEHGSVLVWLMVAATIGYAGTFLSAAMTALRVLRAQPLLLAAVTAIGVVASALLVPRYGLAGAAWAYGVALAFEFAGAAVLVSRAVERIRPTPAGWEPALQAVGR